MALVVVLAEWSEFVDQPAPFKYAPYFMLVWIALGVIVWARRARVAPDEAAAESLGVAAAAS